MSIPRIAIAPGYTISRILKGGWQLAGGHGPLDRATALDDMARFVEAGVTTFDCADIYTGVEALIGEFLRRRHGRPAIQVHTKYVPDIDTLATLTRRDVEAAIDRSLTRLGVEQLDLVQFHWWNYGVPRFIEVARWLNECRIAGKIANLGATNFATAPLREMLDAGVPIVSHQVQYSVLDRRPSGAMTALCEEKGVHLLCYGGVAGGFLSDRFLDRPSPAEPLDNRSLVKYPADDRRGWRLGSFPEDVAGASRDRRSARRLDQRRRPALDAGSAARRRRHRRRPPRGPHRRFVPRRVTHADINRPR